MATLPTKRWDVDELDSDTHLCPSAQKPDRECIFSTDPAVAKNADGRLELFARFDINLE